MEDNDGMKEEIINMLDEEYSSPSTNNEEPDYNAEMNKAAAATPWVKPTTSHHTFRVSEKRWKEIFGHP